MTTEEKKFVKDALRAGNSMAFIADHIWLCRKMNVTPNYSELTEVRKQVNDYFLEAK